MVKIIAEPHRPVENWKAKVEEWVSEVETIIRDAETWAHARSWATKIDEKTISEEMIGTYEAPRLLIHAPNARLLLDPVARSIVGAGGRFDFCAIPSYDSVALVKTDDGWQFYARENKNLDLPWSEESFAKVCEELVKMQ